MKSVLSFVLLFFMSTSLFAQEVKIVFDVTSADQKIHASTMRHVMGMSKAYPNSLFEVVIYSSALPMVLKGESMVSEQVESLAALDNVSFKVCEMTLKRHELDQSDLLKGVGTVPDGILEIINRQNEGWGYIKEAH